MYFLIDFENVRNAGMQGSEYLQPADHVIVFYSAAASGMEQRHLNNIQASGCGFETYKLRRQGKNGLDFYIATKVGELFGANRCQSAVLVSNDAGFKAIREFWQECSGTKNRVAISSSIEKLRIFRLCYTGDAQSPAGKRQSFHPAWPHAPATA